MKISRLTQSKGVNVIGKYLRSLSFHKMMKRLSPHCRSLKKFMRNKMVSYIDFLRPGPSPSRRAGEKKSEASKRLKTRKRS